ncbi:hypothetical protein ACFPM3_33370 [Streptomyces coeruleoprunus]|uniref:Uncharacterized protein n=1 Tax=Streptomyces coeruleoprunus TaxID=285563 RepID=A0ABV9XS88_9ACTN
MKPLRTALAASALALVPVIGLASPAHAQVSVDFDIIGPATLQPNGTVRLVTNLRCTAGADASLFVSLQQVRRGVQSAGGGFQAADCTGGIQELVFVLSSSEGPDFSTGRAYAQGSASVCIQVGDGGFECEGDSDEELIRVRR